MSLAQLGQVQQRTGEDWTGVALTLSTAQPSVGAVLPELDSWFVQVAQPSSPANCGGTTPASQAHRRQPSRRTWRT